MNNLAAISALDSPLRGEPGWKRNLVLHSVGLVMCVSILGVVIVVLIVLLVLGYFGRGRFSR